MTDTYKQIVEKRAALEKIQADAARIESALAAREDKASAQSVAVEAAGAMLKAAKLEHILRPTKDSAVAVEKAERAFQATYSAESTDLEDEELLRVALRQRSAEMAAAEAALKAEEREYYRAKLKAGGQARVEALKRVLAAELAETRLSGPGSWFDFGDWLNNVIRRDEVAEMAQGILAKLRAGEEV